MRSVQPERCSADHPGPWDGIIPSLTWARSTIMASMSITEERKPSIDFSDKYYNTPTVIVGAKGVGWPRRRGLAGKIIGVQASTSTRLCREHFAATAAEIKIYQRR